MKLQILEGFERCQSVTQNHTHMQLSAAYREQVVVSVAAALFLRFFFAGLSTLSLGSTVRMRCGVLVLKSAWPLTCPGFLIWRSFSSSTPVRRSQRVNNARGGDELGSGPQKETYSADHIVFMFSDISLLFFLFYGFFFFYGEILESFSLFGLVKNVFKWNNQRGNITHSWGYKQPVTRSKHCFVLKGHRRWRLGDWSLCLWIQTVWMPEECAVSFRVGLGGGGGIHSQMLRRSLFKDYVCCGKSTIGNLNTRFNKDLTVRICSPGFSWPIDAQELKTSPCLSSHQYQKFFRAAKKKKNGLGWAECKSWGKCRNLGPKWSNADSLTFNSFTVWTNRFPIIPAGKWVSDSLIMSAAPHSRVSASCSHFVTCRIFAALINLPQVLLMPLTQTFTPHLSNLSSLWPPRENWGWLHFTASSDRWCIGCCVYLFRRELKG